MKRIIRIVLLLLILELCIGLISIQAEEATTPEILQSPVSESEISESETQQTEPTEPEMPESETSQVKIS